MTDLIGRRLMTRVGEHVFRVLKVERDMALVVKRGQPAQQMPVNTLRAGLDVGALIDITDRRACPACAAPMNRDPDCRIEWRAERVINGYHDRHKTERKVAHKPVWLCTACDHVEEER